MSETFKREWRFYLDDMITFAEKVLIYTENLDQQVFVESGLNYDATVRNLELMNDTLWSIIRDDVPDLLRQLRFMKEHYQ